MFAGMALVVLYAGIVGAASRSLDHLADQMRTDWYFILPLVIGFGIQIGLMTELRRRHRLHGAAAAGVAGAGASTAGMVACCAHHITELAPFLGASAAATFLTANKGWLVGVGLGINAVGIALALRRLRAFPAPVASPEIEVCKAA